jgi:hypothetical protein
MLTFVLVGKLVGRLGLRKGDWIAAIGACGNVSCGAA